MTRLLTVLAVVATVTASCSSTTDDLGPYDDVLNSSTRKLVVEGDDWTVQAAGDCFWLVVGRQATSCRSTRHQVGDVSVGQWRAGSDRFVFVATGSRGVQVGLFTDRRSRAEIVVHPLDDIGLAVVELEPGEEPWGVQVLDADGALLSAVSLVER